MARITYGNVVAEAAGKLGGIVFARNTAGAYARQKISPIQPRTAAQLQQRNALSSLAKSWGQLTELQRTAWKKWAELQRHSTGLGMTAAPTGMNAYMKLNLQLAAIGAAQRPNPPTNLDPPAVTGLTLTAALNGYLASTNLTARGTGYTTNPTVAYAGGAPEVPAVADAIFAPTTVTGITLTGGGAGYAAAPTVTFVGNAAQSATAICTIAAGSVNTLTLLTAGQGYTVCPNVYFNGVANNATATATVAPTSVTGFDVDERGEGYTATPTVTITGGGGNGATANATLAFETTALILEITTANLPANQWITSIEMTRALPSGRRPRPGDFVAIVATPTLELDQVDVTNQWINQFGALPIDTGWAIGVRATLTNPTTGARTNPIVSALYQP